MAGDSDVDDAATTEPGGVTPIARLVEDPLMYQAAAALPHDDRLVATDRLRRQLRVMAEAAGATPDWTTLAVTGPTEMPGAAAWTRFEWTASVAFRGGASLDEVPDPDWPPSNSTAEGDTVPIRWSPPGENGQPSASAQ